MTKFSDVTKDGTYMVDAHGTLHTMQYDTGYMVGVRPIDFEATFDKEIPKFTVVGRWTDRREGFDWNSGYEIAENVVYWDEVELIDNLLDAGNIARSRGELAIWDNFNGKEIRV